MCNQIVGKREQTQKILENEMKNVGEQQHYAVFFLRNRKQKQAFIKSMEFEIKAAFSKYISRYPANPGPISCAAAHMHR